MIKFEPKSVPLQGMYVMYGVNEIRESEFEISALNLLVNSDPAIAIDLVCFLETDRACEVAVFENNHIIVVPKYKVRDEFVRLAQHFVDLVDDWLAMAIEVGFVEVEYLDADGEPWPIRLRLVDLSQALTRR